MSSGVLSRATASRGQTRLPLVLRIAFRDLRVGWAGFAIFIACIALGVAAIAGVGSLSGALEQGLAREGQAILGGDISLRLVHRQANTEQRGYMNRLGTVSEVATLRAMARARNGEQAAMVRVKAVDARYPLYGAAELEADGKSVPVSALQEKGTLAAEPLLLDRLKLSLGDSVTIGAVAGTSVSRNSTSGNITATFDLSSLADGAYTVTVNFTTPDGALAVTGTNLFTVTSGGGGGGFVSFAFTFATNPPLPQQAEITSSKVGTADATITSYDPGTGAVSMQFDNSTLASGNHSATFTFVPTAGPQAGNTVTRTSTNQYTKP